MTPPCPSFHASQLPLQVQLDSDGKRRKTEGGRPVNLSACELLGMLQYSCSVDRPERPDSPVRCWPVQRWFRKCQDKKGSFMVETTAWEGTNPNATTTASHSDAVAASSGLQYASHPDA